MRAPILMASIALAVVAPARVFGHGMRTAYLEITESLDLGPP
jgi:hypothetical protein